MARKIITKKTALNFFSADVEYQGIGIDIAKKFLSVCTIDSDGSVEYIARMSRDELIEQLAPLTPIPIVMEPCAGSALLAERIEKIGHKPYLVSGSAVKAAVQAQYNGQKNDRNDAYVMARMACNSDYLHRIIPKQAKQRQLAALLAQRNVYVDCQTKIVNSVKGRLLEAGISLNRRNLNAKELFEKLPDDPFIKQMVATDLDVLYKVTMKIAELDRLITDLLSEMPETQYLKTIPGFGPIVIAAFIAVIIDPERFKSGRSLCAYIGLVPRDMSSGGKTRLGRLSKRGNSYLRQMMVIAGMALMRMVVAKNSKVPDSRLRDWVLNQMKKHGNGKISLKCAVACGCKLLRIALSILKRCTTFDWMKAGVSTR